MKKRWSVGNLNLLPSLRFVGRQVVVQFPHVNCMHINTVDWGMLDAGSSHCWNSEEVLDQCTTSALTY